MRSSLVLVVPLMLVSAFIGGANANPSRAEHADYSRGWTGATFVGGLGSCPLFGPDPGFAYELRDVDLSDHITSTYTPRRGPLYRIDSVASLHGLIHAPGGTYRVAGAQFEERRTGALAPRYFSGTGEATLSGPGGTVVGEATFKDLLDFPPQEFDLLFTSVTSCQLGKAGGTSAR